MFPGDGDDDLTYGFEIEVDGVDRDEYLAAIVSTFDRRAKLRVQTDPANSIRAVISPEGGRGEACGRVRDLSEGGISIVTDMVADEVLVGADILRVSVRLPTDSQPLELRAKVHARQSVTSGLLYRMEFLPCSGEDATAENRLAEYVRARQRQPLATV